ncbi:3-phosphoshikimate 1-carboxyvinyltransferase [Kordiimonas sediminis]|uniref:3-phosphoshikimate 1-carboxyvinyltransferase n=1 Tax=Kordiimonas sediminis TaxID=1735581 RepID=A0A919E4N2_9PROT|nr:3-phosphoshikimate 1-carboxyvinyltransferase [Kordiimonas sediminis]GHF13269.1 3-phosphoshikimate 1-carboxyvinyltransferase [Kordiimonas sediminis]
MPKLLTSPFTAFEGQISVPGDKSISHRSIMLPALAVGESRIVGLLEGEDVLATADAMRAMGARVEKQADGSWSVWGVGVGGLTSPDKVLDFGNSGTSTRLLMGLIASHDITVMMTGDASLRSRPMSRVMNPLMSVGAQFVASEGGRLPVTEIGAKMPLPLDYTTPMASAQVKSAVLLAGLNTPGTTIVREAVSTRDHTERMLKAMGADITVEENGQGRTITLVGQPELQPISIIVPGDISSAAFILVAASIIPGADVMISHVGMNPLRTGIIAALQAMGADIDILNAKTVGGEEVADLHVRGAALKGISSLPVDPSTMIDEFPVLFCAAAVAEGESVFTGLEEMRVKESDRIAVMAAGLAANGVQVEELEDGLKVTGCGGKVPGGAEVATHLDHRIAMSFAVLGQMAVKPITIDDASPIQTSFPTFVSLMSDLGAGLSLQA